MNHEARWAMLLHVLLPACGFVIICEFDSTYYRDFAAAPYAISLLPWLLVLHYHSPIKYPVNSFVEVNARCPQDRRKSYQTNRLTQSPSTKLIQLVI